MFSDDANLRGDLQRIADGVHHDPHSVLGVHARLSRQTCLAYLPATRDARVADQSMLRVADSDFFAWEAPLGTLRGHLPIAWQDSRGDWQQRIDPYGFLPTIGATDLEEFAGGRHVAAWRFLGAQPMQVDGIAGVRFAVWAPNAARVSVVGPLCEWDGRRYPMRVLGGSGVWELFMPGLGAGEFYKFEIRSRHDGALTLKSDPYGRASELRPATASIVTQSAHSWGDGEWMQRRAQRDWLHAPMSIYEVHAASWRRHDQRLPSWRELAAELLPYVREHGFTHIELLPVTEHPLDDSWGYQTTGYFAPTSRHGSPDDLRHFIDQAHQAGIGLLLYWVPGQFPRDAHVLAT